MSLKKSCPKCRKLIDYAETYCNECTETMKQNQSIRRGSASQRGYDSRWRKAREGFLRANPLCVECMKENKYVPATVVDHIIPHKGDKQLFWDKNNWQSLCKYHHDIKTATKDGGFNNKVK